MRAFLRPFFIVLMFCGLFVSVISISAEPWPDADPSGPWPDADPSGPWTPTPEANAPPAPTTTATPVATSTATPAGESIPPGPTRYGNSANLLRHYTFDQLDGNRTPAISGQPMQVFGNAMQTAGVLGNGLRLGTESAVQSETKIQLPTEFTLTAWVRPSADADEGLMTLQTGFSNQDDCAQWQSGSGIVLVHHSETLTPTLTHKTCSTDRVAPQSSRVVSPIDKTEWIFVSLTHELRSHSDNRPDQLLTITRLNNGQPFFAWADDDKPPPSLNELLRAFGSGFDIDEIKLFSVPLTQDELAFEYAAVFTLQRDQRIAQRGGAVPSIPRPYNIVDDFGFDDVNMLANSTNGANVLQQSTDHPPIAWTVGGINGKSMHLQSGGYTMQRGVVGRVNEPYTLSFWFQNPGDDANAILEFQTAAYAYSTTYPGCRNNCQPYDVYSITELELRTSDTGVGVLYSSGVGDYGRTPTTFGARADGKADDWYHIVVTPNKLFINGAMVLRVDAYSSPMHLLYWYESSPLLMWANSMNVDEITTYAVTLSEDEVIDLYLANRPK